MGGIKLMCIILYKPKGVEMPSREILENCFNNNDDGAGFMYAINGIVHIKKGYMQYASLEQAILELSKSLNLKNTAIILHFRISTQGAISPENTHPYPLSTNMKDLQQLSFTTKVGIAHNGIIPLTTNYGDKIYNDTMLFTTEYLSLIIKDINYYKNNNTIKLIEKLCESKLAILSANEHCELIGNGWIRDNGIYYSNLSYKQRNLLLDHNYIERNYQFCLNEYETEVLIQEMANDYYCASSGLFEFDSLDCPVLYDNYKYCDFCANREMCYKA